MNRGRVTGLKECPYVDRAVWTVYRRGRGEGIRATIGEERAVAGEGKAVQELGGV